MAYAWSAERFGRYEDGGFVLCCEVRTFVVLGTGCCWGRVLDAEVRSPKESSQEEFGPNLE